MSIENNLKPEIKSALEELFNTGKIQAGENLSRELNAINKHQKLNFEVPPTYNFLRLKKKTVFCHLNPGGNPSKEKFRKFIRQFSDSDEFISYYVKTKENYPKLRFLDKGDFDNFDYKQALFLSGFPNNGIDLKSIHPDWIELDKEKRSYDCYSVLQNKTQLELLPFESKSFKSLFHSCKKTIEVFPFISNYLENLLDIIISYEREYIIFGSDQYSNLFLAANNNLSEFQIIVKTEKIPLDIGTKNKAYVSIYEIKWKCKVFVAIIAHSFPRQDLPNAFDKMRLYGKLSYLEFNNFKKAI